MLIKDEPYVAYLLTRYEKKQRDIVKYGVDVSNGDRIVYRHHTSPEFNIGKRRIRLKITTRDWHLKLVSHMKWLAQTARLAHARSRLPRLVHRPAGPREPAHDADYDQALRVLKCPEEVTGYREVRYPKMDRVREAIEAELVPLIKPPRQPPAACSTRCRTMTRV